MEQNPDIISRRLTDEEFEADKILGEIQIAFEKGSLKLKREDNKIFIFDKEGSNLGYLKRGKVVW